MLAVKAMSGKTKKELILELFEQASMTRLSETEVRLIQKQLIEILGVEQQTSTSYIARVLAEAGKPVQIQDSFSLPVMEEPYRQVFEGVLKFGTLNDAEHSLRRLGALYQEFKVAGDRKGMGYARSVAVVGKRRAQAASRRAKSSEEAAVKQEIAQWFAIWMDAPSLFDEWLDLRKQSPEFKMKWRSPDIR